MEQDRVNFQQLGWSKEEIMAGLALVLPLNIWHYVVQEANMARFGKRIVLQGGTQKNLAAVKAQVDYIKNKIPDAEIYVHTYADICGAIGAALEAMDHRIHTATTFIGLHNAAAISFKSSNNENTRCHFCQNKCPRTFIDITTSSHHTVRYISGYGCERGSVESLDKMRARENDKKQVRVQFPNLVHQASINVFKEYPFEPLPKQDTEVPRSEYYPATAQLNRHWPRHHRFERSSPAARRRREAMIIGIPKLLNMYYYAPFFSTYFRALGVGEILYSDYTSSRLWEEGNKWGAIDPCFPAKVAPAHIYNLIQKKKCTHICFPIITHLESLVENTLGNNACVIQMGTPEVVDAVFTRERDFFSDNGIVFWKPLVSMDKPREVVGLLYAYFKERLQITEDENAWAVEQGHAAMREYIETLRNQGRQIINWLIDNDRIGILAIGHPYHHDPGLNHGICEEFQLNGFPVLCIESLPLDDAFINPLFAHETDGPAPATPLDIRDVWMRNFNRNTNIKIWAAKIAARHPNLAVIDFSSFKCGHDAPTYSYIDNILDASETPHFLFHDIDQNKPGATFSIRIKTIDYFLKLEEERLRNKIQVSDEL
jgi:predicted nucleotide-binding protein (sugar kinase/HSP70/actin superfamily)